MTRTLPSMNRNTSGSARNCGGARREPVAGIAKRGDPYGVERFADSDSHARAFAWLACLAVAMLRPFRLETFLTINPGRCPGLSSVGLSALRLVRRPRIPRRPEGMRRTRHARGPRAQRHRARVRFRQRAG